MNQDLIFDWVALAPPEAVVEVVDEICKGQGLRIRWATTSLDDLPMYAGTIMTASGQSAVSLTLQGYWPDQTHLRLLPSQDLPDQFVGVGILADALFGILRLNGWMPTEDGAHYAPRFLRPAGFRPRPGDTVEQGG
jgi:hypothetical protein